MISRVAVIGGAGGEDVPAAHQAGADVLFTGEARHHHALAAQALGMALIDAGHYETERVVLPALISRLHQESSEIQYKVTRVEQAAFWRP